MTETDTNSLRGVNDGRGDSGESERTDVAGPDDPGRSRSSRRRFVKVVGAGAVTGTLLAGAVGTASAAPIVVDDFDGSPPWPGENDLGEWTGAGELGNGSGTITNETLRLEYDDGGWFATNVRDNVASYQRLEIEMRGDAGGEESDVQLEIGGVEDTLANLTDDTITTSFSTVAVDLPAAGVDRTSLDDVWLEFTPGTSGAIEIDEIRFAGEQSGPPPIGENSPPQDLDGDGQYRDVNGNGRLDNDDVVTYFESMNDAAITDNVDNYDFNGNGRIDFDDLVTLFEGL